MTWKTSASSHIQAFVINFAVLAELLRVCSNGLIPDAMLEKADIYLFRFELLYVFQNLDYIMISLCAGLLFQFRPSKLHTRRTLSIVEVNTSMQQVVF